MDELFEKIIYRALTQKATDIHFVLRKHLSIQFRIFGQLCHYDDMEIDEGSKLMNYMKYKSSINTNHRLLPQTGDLKITISKKVYYLRVSYLPSTEFESIVIRILNNHDILTIDQLTYQQETKDFLQWLTHQKSGLFLISGATGSGKSTTLYTILHTIIQQYQLNIITIEDPIEIHLDHCLQIELNEKLGITYQQTLKQILRHDPDIIMIGEIRDEQTAKIAITCALTGHLVLTTIHASNAPLSLKRLMNLGVEQVDVMDVVIGAMSQQILYHPKKQQLLVLSEIMNQKQIINYLQDHVLDYHDFQYQANLLLKQGFSKELLGDMIHE